MAYLVSSSSCFYFFPFYLFLSVGGDIRENIQKSLFLPFYIMFLRCFLIPLYFAYCIDFKSLFVFWHSHLYLLENGGFGVCRG